MKLSEDRLSEDSELELRQIFRRGLDTGLLERERVLRLRYLFDCGELKQY